MAKTRSRSANLTAIRKRLRGGTLSSGDVRVIEGLLKELQKLERTPKKKTGQRLIARLPFGMDIVK